MRLSHLPLLASPENIAATCSGDCQTIVKRLQFGALCRRGFGHSVPVCFQNKEQMLEKSLG
jgi:hypothetical protein